MGFELHIEFWMFRGDIRVLRDPTLTPLSSLLQDPDRAVYPCSLWFSLVFWSSCSLLLSGSPILSEVWGSECSMEAKGQTPDWLFKICVRRKGGILSGEFWFSIYDFEKHPRNPLGQSLKCTPDFKFTTLLQFAMIRRQCLSVCTAVRDFCCCYFGCFVLIFPKHFIAFFPLI